MKTFFLGVSHQLKTLLVLALICISFSSCPEMFGKLNNIHDPSSSSYIAPSSRFTLTPGNLVNGSMTPATAIQVTSGAATTITAYANAGYVFDSWSATPSGNATFANFAGVTTTVTLTGDATVIAIFILSSQLIYKTDFSINPGWVANDSSRYYWDSATGSYYTNNYTNSGDWATTPISYNGGSFKLQFDIKATTRDTGDVCFGLFDSSRMSHNSPTAESLFVLLGGYTPVVYLEYNHNGINFSSPSNISWNTNTWYHTEVDYNSVSLQLSFTVSSNGSTVGTWQGTLSSSLSSSLSNLGISMNGNWATSNRNEVAYFDNIEMDSIANSAYFAYVANNGTSGISAYSIDSNGVLAQLSGSPFVAQSGTTGVTATPNGKYLYAENAYAQVNAYSISSSGILTQISGSPFSAGTGPEAGAVTPNGSFLYVAHTNAGSGSGVSAFSIGSNGALTELTSLGSPFPTGVGPESISVAPNGNFLYIANHGGGVSAYSIGTNGALTSLGSLYSAGMYPNATVITPNGSFLYVTNNGGGISAFSIGANGALVSLGLLAAVVGSPSGITITPNGNYLYIPNYGGGVYAESIGSNGILSQIVGSPYAAGTGPAMAAITPDGKFLYVTNETSGNVSAYSISPDGTLVQLSSSPFPAGSVTAGITIVAVGQ